MGREACPTTMELLLHLIGAFIGVVLLVALVPALVFLELLAGAVFEIVCGALKVPSLLRRSATPVAQSVWPRRIGKGLLALTGLTVVLVLLLNTVFFEPALRRGLDRVRAKTGVNVQFESAEGSFLTGDVTLRNVTAAREDALRSNLNLRIQEVRANLAITSLTGTPRLESLYLRDVDGVYQRGRLPSPKRGFVVDHFVVERASLILREPESEKPAADLPLIVETLECRPLRKDFALFDLLFRSNGRGSIERAPFEIRMEGNETGRTTRWKAQGLPVGFLAGYVGEPFDWLTAGTLDVDVLDTWSNDGSPEIDSHWTLTLRDATAAVPERITGMRRAIAEPVVRYIQAHPVSLPLEFRLQLHEGHFTGAASLETTGLLEAAADGVLEDLARRAKVPAERVKEIGRRTLDGFKRFVGDRKKK